MVEKRILFTKRAIKDLEQVDFKQRGVIKEALVAFAETGQGDVKKLKGCDDEWRLRVGDYRVRFFLQGQALIVTVLRVRHRRDAYRD